MNELLPKEAMEELVKTYQIGASKYSPDDWRIRYTKEQMLIKLERHLLHIIFDKEEVDKENGQYHMAAVAFHALGYLQKLLIGEK